MRVLILAYDGLEYELVMKWKLKNIMQKRYGKYRSAISPRYGKPHTPSAWTTIITGKPPEEHGIDDWWSFGKVLDWIRYKPPLKWIKGKRLFLRKLGIELKPKIVGREHIRHKTIFDLTAPSIAVNVPAWNEPTEPHEEYAEALKKSVNEYLRVVWKWHKKRVNNFWDSFHKDWKLLMAWFDLVDIIGHVCIAKCTRELWKGYIALDKLAKDVSQKIQEDTLLLIISDHGMKPTPDGTGDHSRHGFWSINKDLEWFNPREAIDFYQLIRKALEQKT